MNDMPPANAFAKPQAYDLQDPKDFMRLLRETHGYLQTCVREHHGTDREGRSFAIDALSDLIHGRASIPQSTK